MARASHGRRTVKMKAASELLAPREIRSLDDGSAGISVQSRAAAGHGAHVGPRPDTKPGAHDIVARFLDDHPQEG